VSYRLYRSKNWELIKLVRVKIKQGWITGTWEMGDEPMITEVE
jgi:hypothetical protein